MIGCRDGDAAGPRVRARVRNMMNQIVRRGPDAEGLLDRPGAVLGMRRLSIIDLASGNQPVFNEDGDVAIVFNGEIYNFPQLRAQLEPRHRFRTHSDTEVIVHAYEEWGEGCLEHLRGMFAFAIWDGRGPNPAGRVLLARDRLGIKPLYYTVANGMLWFASEVRALLASDAVPRQIEPKAVESYLLFGSVVEPMTLVHNVFSLPPGYSVMVACGAAAQARPASYWNPPLAERGAAAAGDRPKDFAAAARATRPLLEEAVRSHLIADVPIGVFLSSGLDSTAIAALASRERKGLHTFTVVFPEEEFSEGPLARQTAATLGCEHRELLVSAEHMQTHLTEAVCALDQPSMDGVNTFFVSWAVRQAGLKVAISGLGGDEVFGGYATFRNSPHLSRIADLARMIPGPVRRAMSQMALGISGEGGLSSRSDKIRKVASLWSDPGGLPHPYFYTRMLFTPQQLTGLMSLGTHNNGSAGNGNGAPLTSQSWLDQVTRQAEALEGDSRVSWFELRTYMVDTLLRDTDSMSMYHSLEVRVPLLDHPLVEFVTALPDHLKRRPGVAKALLVEALGDLLPREIVRQPKRGFTFPWQRWLQGPLRQEIGEQLGDLSPSLARILDAQTVQSIWQNFLGGRTGWARPWSLFVLNNWVRHHVDVPVSAGVA